MLVFGLMVPVSNPVFAITPIFWMKPQLSASYSNIVRGAVVYICITASALALGIYCCLVESVRSLLWFDLYGNQQ